MALILTYPTLSTIYNSAEGDTNNSNISSKFGNIKDVDIASGANISLDKIAGSTQEVWIQLAYYFDISGVWPVDSSGGAPVAIVPIPGSNGDVAWTLTDISWVCTDVGTTVGKFGIRQGYINDGTWTETSVVVNDIDMTLTTGFDNENQGKALEGGTGSFALTATNTCLGLFSDDQGVGVLTAAKSYLQVTVALQRVIF